MTTCKDCKFYEKECESHSQQKMMGLQPSMAICEIFCPKQRLIKIPSDGIVRIPIMRGDTTVGETRVDLSSYPIVDAVEVVHGRWEWYTNRCEDLFLGCDEDYGWRCSLCKTSLDEDDPELPPVFLYCPNCGAKMYGGSNNV